MKKGEFKLSTTHIIMASFMLTILTGAVLLSLPISSATGQAIPFLDALFTATSATCVTGLVVAPTVTTWSVFGQVVLLALIQIGGLGLITVLAGLTSLFHRKMKLSDSLLIQDAFNLNTLSGLGHFIKKVIWGTLLVEGTGAILYMFVFVPDFGLRGIWISIFNAISAFCNAGIDIIAADSLCSYATNPLVNGVTCMLIFLGGLGYIVWWDVLRVFSPHHPPQSRRFRNLFLYSKLAIATTLVLIFGGALLIFLFEHDNPLTLGKYNLFDKIQMSFFQSVTTRTAGFASLPQENLTNPSAMVCVLLMFVGGSPVGTAGGIKTVTLTVMLASAVASIKNREDACIFHRNLPKQVITKAIAVTTMFFFIVATSTIALAAVTDAPAMDIIYECVSATATVGLSRNLTPSLNSIGKVIIIGAMYFGRVGPISLAVALNLKKQHPNTIKNPTEDISVG